MRSPSAARRRPQDNRIIARGYNQTERLNDCTAHAEIIALTSAFNLLGSKYLPDATLYVTVEPCPDACAVAPSTGVRSQRSSMARTTRRMVIAGAFRHGPLANCGLSIQKPRWSKRVLASQSADLMRKFFKDKR